MKKVLLLVAAVFLLLAIPATVFLVAQRQELRKRAAPATTLSLAPATNTKNVGDTFTLEVKIDTGENQVVAAEMQITFDPEKLEAQSITNGSLFPNILTSGVVDRGTASISVGAQSSSQPVRGTGTAAVLRLRALAATGDTPVTVRFAPNTFVSGLGEAGQNILVGSNPARVTIGGTGTAATTPFPTPTLEATGSGTATSSAVRVESPANNASVTDDQPTLRGKAPAGSTVTITIYSDPITATVTADANGNWSYTPTTPLSDGPHNVVASVLVAGQTQSATSSFVVAAGGGSSTQSATPIAGSVENTLALVLLGGTLFALGLARRFLWHYS